LEAAIAAARLVHYASVTGLFGLALFPLYAEPMPGLRRWLTGLSLMALLSGLAWLLLVTANLAGAIDAEALGAVILDMGFGRVWAVRLALGLVLLVLVAGSGARAKKTTVALAGLYLCSIALTGHTQTHDGLAKALHVTADAAHLAGAGAWLGGLIGLSLMLPTLPHGAAGPVARFSRMAYVAVGVLAVSGVVNALMLVGSLGGLLSSFYGRLLLVKLALFAAMLALAAINRLHISPRLTGADAAAQGERLRRHVIAEQALGVAVLGCVAWLGLGQPPS
jgi:copper resistance protein D